MPLPRQLEGRLSLPVVAAPMFLASGPDLVIASCKAGMIGTFPALNQRTSEGFEEWLNEIGKALSPADAPYGVNLIVHRTNPRLAADIDIIVRHKVPVVITSMGAAPEVVEAVHSYGGVIFHDVIGLRHARKAAEAGVDGLVLVANGAGGHGGTLNPFAFAAEVRAFFDRTILLGGAISTGAHVAAARLMGADLAYMGTRFLAAAEATIGEEQRRMLMDADAEDIVYTPSISGVSANFLRQSLVAAGLDPQNPPPPPPIDVKHESAPGSRAWKDIWSAGQGVGAIDGIVPVADLVARLAREYDSAFGVDPRAGLAS